ncbi:hypothetical protein OUZ56_003399 [Daphnia magna]|uniref:Uncharacterized protein n=1 Tax=Daphnia magna TaxID=35525 RepID=A0ABR0A8J7_9CRUS|nr:hypothetical protein OUZ56_003399 [Daphnia magna]
MLLTNAQVFVVEHLGFRRLQMVLFVTQHIPPFLGSQAFFALLALATAALHFSFHHGLVECALIC